MLLSHAATLTEARSYLAALADNAATVEGSLAYERTLLHLDSIHGDDVPALDTAGLAGEQDAFAVATESAIEALVEHGVDALQVELVLAMLGDARKLDVQV